MFDKKDIKVIAIDFDGTLLQKDHIWISPRNMHALKECQKRGILCIPCTGRPFDMFPPQIHDDPSFRYAITCCGARIIDRETNTLIYKDGYTPEQTAAICRLFEGQGVYAEVTAGEHIYFEQNVLDELWKYQVPAHHVWYAVSDRPVGVQGKLSEFFLRSGIGADKFNLYGVPDAVRTTIRANMAALASTDFNDDDVYAIQLMFQAKDPLKPIQVLLDHLGYTFDNVMSIGDTSWLDSMMAKHAAFSVTLENGSQAMKDLCDYTTDSCDKDGFAKAVEKFIL